MERWLSGLKRIPAKDKYLFGTKGSNPFLSVFRILWNKLLAQRGGQGTRILRRVSA